MRLSHTTNNDKLHYCASIRSLNIKRIEKGIENFWEPYGIKKTTFMKPSYSSSFTYDGIREPNYAYECQHIRFTKNSI